MPPLKVCEGTNQGRPPSPPPSSRLVPSRSSFTPWPMFRFVWPCVAFLSFPTSHGRKRKRSRDERPEAGRKRKRNGNDTRQHKDGNENETDTNGQTDERLKAGRTAKGRTHPETEGSRERRGNVPPFPLSLFPLKPAFPFLSRSHTRDN